MDSSQVDEIGLFVHSKIWNSFTSRLEKTENLLNRTTRRDLLLSANRTTKDMSIIVYEEVERRNQLETIIIVRTRIDETLHRLTGGVRLPSPPEPSAAWLGMIEIQI